MMADNYNFDNREIIEMDYFVSAEQGRDFVVHNQELGGFEGHFSGRGKALATRTTYLDGLERRGKLGVRILGQNEVEVIF